MKKTNTMIILVTVLSGGLLALLYSNGAAAQTKVQLDPKLQSSAFQKKKTVKHKAKKTQLRKKTRRATVKSRFKGVKVKRKPLKRNLRMQNRKLPAFRRNNSRGAVGPVC